MGLNFTVGSVRGTFEGSFAQEVAVLLDNAFGGETDWEGVEPQPFGESDGPGWAELQARAIDELGTDAIPNLLALGPDGRGVYLPANLQATSLPLSIGGELRCASLPGLRNELAELADRWELPLDDLGLTELLRVAQDPDDGCVADSPEIQIFARLALAANAAVRKDCPLWLVGSPDAGNLPPAL
jgi:hypothetical protein